MVHLTAVTLMQWRKLFFWWLLQNTGGTSVAEGSPWHVDRNGFVFVTFHGAILSCGFSQERNSRI